jgi:hypothetical protein
MQPQAEATSAILSVAIAGLLSLLGVPPYTLVWGLIGAVFAMLLRTAEVGKVKGILIVIFSAAIAAALGVVSGELTEKPSRAIITAVCVVVGFGAQAFLSALVSAGVSNIKRFDRTQGDSK